MFTQNTIYDCCHTLSDVDSETVKSYDVKHRHSKTTVSSDVMQPKNLGEPEVKLGLTFNYSPCQSRCTAKKFEKTRVRKGKGTARDSGCEYTLFRQFSIGGPLQSSITND